MDGCLEDECISCLRETKYICILCSIPICNVCSIAELDDEIEGWVAGRRVSYCNVCYDNKPNKCTDSTDIAPDEVVNQNVIQSGLQRKATVNSSSSNVEDSEDPTMTSDDEDKEVLNTGTKLKKQKSGRKAKWSDSLVNDMVDIIVNNDYYKNKLIFVNTKNQKNAEIYGRILVELRVRASKREETLPFTAVQMRTKFKKLISECKKAALTIRTATGIKRFQEEKGYGSWFDQLYPLVKTRDSCQPEQAIEPSNERELPQSSTSSTSPETIGSDVSANLFVPLKIKKAKKENHMNEVVGMLKNLVDKDPMKDFIAFAKEDAEKSRQQELRMMEIMMQSNNQPPTAQFQNHGMQSHQANLNVNQVYGIPQQYTEENGQVYFKF